MDSKELKLIDIGPSSQNVIGVEKSKLELKDAISFVKWVPGSTVDFGLSFFFFLFLIVVGD